jgi:hypothetical protein
LKVFEKFNKEDAYQSCDCPERCETVSYTFTSSIAAFPTKSFADSLMKNPAFVRKFNKSSITYEDIRKSVVSVNIFFNENIETSIIGQKKNDIASLISSIGGVLGLFLGYYFKKLLFDSTNILN